MMEIDKVNHLLLDFKVNHLLLDFRFHQDGQEEGRLTAAGHVTLEGLETLLRLAPALGEPEDLVTSLPLPGWGQARPWPQEKGRSGHSSLGAGDPPSCHQHPWLHLHRPDQRLARGGPPLMAGLSPPTCQESALLRRHVSVQVWVSHQVPPGPHSREESSTSLSSATKSRWTWSPGPGDTTSPSPEVKAFIQELNGKVYMQTPPRDLKQQGQDQELYHPDMDPVKKEHHDYTDMLKVAPDKVKDANYARLMHMQGLTEETKPECYIQVYLPYVDQTNCIPGAQDIPSSLHPEVRGQERPLSSESRVAVSGDCQAELNPKQGPVSAGQYITSQGRTASEVSRPTRLQEVVLAPTCTRTSLPTLRHVLSMTGPGPLLAAAAAGGSVASWLLIGQCALKMGRIRSMTCGNHALSHGIGPGITQYFSPYWHDSQPDYKDSFPCCRNVSLAAAMCSSGHSDRLQTEGQLTNSMAGSCQDVTHSIIYLE